MGKTALNPKQRRALKKASPGARASMAANFARQAAQPKPATKKKAPKPQQRRASGVVGAAFGGHYNAFHKSPQPIARAVGHATTIRGFGRAALTHADDALYTMVVFSMAPNTYVATYASNRAADSTDWRVRPAEVDKNYWQIPGTQLAIAGGPTTALFGKMSVRLRNTTKATEVGGSVYCLALDTGCSLEEMTDAGWQAKPGWSNLRDYILGCPRTRVFSGAELMKTRQWSLHPIDAGRALEFHNTEPSKHGYDTFRNTLEHPVFSQLVFLFANNPQNNYEFTFANQLYARYELGGPLANAATSVPTASINLIDGARKLFDEIGSVGALADDAKDLVGALGAFKMNV